MTDGTAGENFIKRMKNDYELRTIVASAVSVFITLLFTGYNIFLGAVYGSVWNIFIAIYYALLVGIRTFVLAADRKYKKNAEHNERDRRMKINTFLIQSILLFIIDIALIGPISIMVLQKKVIHFSELPAIANAAYTTYKLVSAAVNFKKSKKHANLSVRMLKNINFIDSLVSLLSLQYVLIMTFGEGVTGDMFVWCAISSFAIWGIIVVSSIKSLVKAVKIKKTYKASDI